MRKTILYLSLITLLFSCSSNTSQTGETGNQTNAEVQDTTPVNELASFKFSYTIANLPSPLQVLDEFSKAGLPINISLLNPVENVNNYHNSLKHAFNYGIYGMDLGYLVVNNRTLEALQYYNASKKLAEALNMSETFNRFVNRFESNSGNKDSLTHVIDEAYTATDSYLRSNERLVTASQVLAGSWLECQYLTVNLLLNTERTKENDILFQHIWEQRLYLDNITKLLDEFKDDAELVKIKNDYQDLLSIYKEPSNASQIDRNYLMRLAKGLEKTRNNIIK